MRALLALFGILAVISISQTKEFMRVCYFTSWSKYRSNKYSKFDIKDINPKLCTHLVYAFGQIDTDSKLLAAHEPLVEDPRPGHAGRYSEFNKLKLQNPSLKTLLSIGGQFDDGRGFRIVSENDIIVKRFAENTAIWLRTRQFDGLDIDWEYPNKDTKRTFITLLRALRDAFVATPTHPKLLLTIAAPAGKDRIDEGFDVPGINRYVDYVNLMTYDYSGFNPTVTAFNAPLYSRKDPAFNPTYSVDYTFKYYHSRGLDVSKMVVGVTPMGLHYVLKNENDTYVGAHVYPDREPGDFFAEDGRRAYAETCLMRASVLTDHDYDIEQEQPFMWRGDEWVGYEDTNSARKKVEYMLKQGAAGFMFWSLDQDDFTGKACEEGRYPLLTSMVNTVVKVEEPVITEHVAADINYMTMRGSATAQCSSGSWTALITLLAVVILAFFK